MNKKSQRLKEIENDRDYYEESRNKYRDKYRALQIVVLILAVTLFILVLSALIPGIFFSPKTCYKTEHFTISYELGKATKVYDTSKIVNYLCDDGIEVWKEDGRTYFEFSWTDIQIMEYGFAPLNLKYTCIIKLKEECKA